MSHLKKIWCFFCLIFLFVQKAEANRFSLNMVGQRFTLSISENELTYESESLRKKIPGKPCNKRIFTRFNEEILLSLPKVKSLNSDPGLNFKVDDMDIPLSSNDKILKLLLAMDIRIHQLLIEESKSCP
jgi:hypothetical protein